VNPMSLGGWLWRPVWGLREVGRGDVLLAGLLSLLAIGLASGALKTNYPFSGAVAAAAALALTLPVAWQRRAPVAAAAAVAVAAPLNGLIIGPMVRCAAALPAVFAIAFFNGTRCTGRRLAAGTVLCLGAVTAQAFFDPVLGPGFLAGGLPIVAGFCLAGRLARSRSLTAAQLRRRNAELLVQQERTARLAVAADRARVAEDLEGFLRDRIVAMAQAAEAGRKLVACDPTAAQGAFAAVENSGRATLAQMREVVGTLREEAPTEPQPVLAQLGDLLERATSADARLSVEGSPRALPAGVELSGYRIVEHLVAALDDDPQARIDVRVRFGPGALELRVAGPASRHADPAGAFAVARERAALLGGSLRIDTSPGRCDALVRLPLAPGHA
jgi:signal transduction histidine kinase